MQAAIGQQSLKYVEKSMRGWFGLLKLYKDGQLDELEILTTLTKKSV
jgi:hypothetical protein